MLYGFLKIIARIAIKIFCRKITINKPELLREKGPLLLASNHPNSFLDSIIMDTIFKESIWSLARGDVFKKPIHIKLLTALKILPVYRTSEGVENLSGNYKTFNDCITLFKQGQVIMIFSEGKCINEWHLRPLKKGTARLAMKAWEEGIPLKVLPVGINYSSFRRFGKNMYINFGENITKEEFDLSVPDGVRHQLFNNKLQSQLEQLVFEISKTDKQKQEEIFVIRPSVFRKIILFLPAALGWLIHLPLYLPVRNFTWKRTYDNDHYDSVVTGILFITYPLYLILITSLLLIITNIWWMVFILLILPFTAWAYTQLKPQLDK